MKLFPFRVLHSALGEVNMGLRRRLARVSGFVAMALFLGCSSAPKPKEFPDDYSAKEIRDMGSKLLGAGETGRALKILSMALEKDKTDPETHYYFGLAYSARGLEDKALEHFRIAVELDRDYSEVYNAMGVLHARKGNVSEARGAFEKALSNPFYDTPHYALFNLGRLYEKCGDNEKALAQYREALRLEASYPMAYYRMGRVLESMGRRDEARNAYGEAVYYDSNNAEAQFHYGRLCFLTGDQDRAYDALSQVVLIKPRTNLARAAREYLQKIEQARMPPPEPAYGYPFPSPYDNPFESPYEYGY